VEEMLAEVVAVALKVEEEAVENRKNTLKKNPLQNALAIILYKIN
jgi:hypothetical protein